MTFKHKFTLVIALLALVSTTAFAAEAPGNVGSVDARIENGALTVNWTAASDTSGIAYYRVYFSRESILENAGDYDDYERTQGSDTSFTFASLPYTSGKAYIGVLAVNNAGVESDGFEVEAVVDMPGSAPVSSAPTSNEVQSSTPANIPFAILSLRPMSSTGVMVELSKPLKAGMNLSPDYFVLVDSGGVMLRVTDVVADGTRIQLKTEPQVAGRTYVFGLLRTLEADDGSTMDMNSPQIPFVGMAGEAASSAPSVAANSSSSVGYIRNPALPPVGSVIEKPTPTTPVEPTPNKPLPDSGPGLLAAIALSGAAAGWHMRKKKRVA